MNQKNPVYFESRSILTLVHYKVGDKKKPFNKKKLQSFGRLKKPSIGYISLCVGLIWLCPVSTAYANSEKNVLVAMKHTVNQLFGGEQEHPNTIKMSDFDDLFTNESNIEMQSNASTSAPTTSVQSNQSTRQLATRETSLDLLQAIQHALQRRPEITQGIAEIEQQYSNIDTVKARYFPQISGGLSTGDFTSGERGRQVLSISATQMLYDFGKVKNAVTVEEAKLLQDQAQLLMKIDEIAYQVAEAVANIKRYEELVKIADQQISGIARIAEIARLRANAGISTQADPVQAQSNLEAAQSARVLQEAQLLQYQQKLRTLLGYDVSNLNFTLPEVLVEQSGLYQKIDFNRVPEIMAAQSAVEVAKFQKQQTKLDLYPTLNIKGSISQAVNGRNPNNNQDDGFYQSIMLEASSNFIQGGASRSRNRAASYAEEAAKAKVNTAYLNILDEIRSIQTQVEYKQKQITVLAKRRETTRRIKELYQEQYKLGTRTVVDLLNAEQSIHGAAQEIEAARYDIYVAIMKYIEITGRSRTLYQLNHRPIQGFEVVS